MKMLVIESRVDELIPERYAATIMSAANRIKHWDTIEVEQGDYLRYEELRIALDDLLTEIKEKARD